MRMKTFNHQSLNLEEFSLHRSELNTSLRAIWCLYRSESLYPHCECNS